MCRRTTCKSCGKPSFAGCGMHVEQVLAGVPKPQRCSCATDAAAGAGAGAKSAAGAGSWFARLWRRS
ncbi:hypothetical protein ACFC6L_22955 [Kitasatospora phosalacinea]|uniref:hypothetical protein n=1 Tax=Kitasatospora phosalacinea TaxID=2065 RepID=UPI0035DB3591